MGYAEGMSLRPRALSWRGTIPADALWLDPDLLGEAEVRDRVLALWQPGCAADRLAGGVLLRLPSPQRMRAEQAPGLVLQREGGRLWAAPLTSAERAALPVRDLPADAVVLIRGGEVDAVPLSAGQHIEPAQWLSLDGLRWEQAQPLGRLPPPPAPPPEQSRVSAALGVAPAEELSALLGELTPSPDGVKVPAKGGRGGWGWAGGAASAARSAQGWMDQAASSVGGGGLGDLFRRGERWLDQLAEQLGVLGALEKLSSRRGADHIRKMLGAHERGDTDSLLREAIPLSNRRSGGRSGASGLGKGLSDLFSWSPAQRDALTFRPRGGDRVSSMTLGEKLFARLREVYRAAFEQLDAAGRHREAAYVLSELLDETQEAIDYLIRRGEPRLAAELAEAAQLDVPQIVRLWVLAGEAPRALLILRLTERFADTVELMDREADPEQAAWLRRRWATWLAESGRYLSAAEALWPIPAAREQAVRWLDRAIGLGGVAGAEAMGRKLQLRPDLAEAVGEQITPYLSDDSSEGRLARVVLARGLRDNGLVAGARPLLRRLLLDQTDAPTRGRWEAIRDLAATADPAMAADMPPALRQSGLAPPPLKELDLRPGDAGTRPALDAGLVWGGRVLVALGEAGCVLLGADGQPEHRFTAPADHLVLADHGTSALALVPRGRGWLVHRLDLASRSETRWLEGVALHRFADTYSGDLWFIVIGDKLLAVDAASTQSQIQALWQFEADTAVLSLARTPKRIDIITLDRRGGPQNQDKYTWDLLHYTLALPGPVPSPPRALTVPEGKHGMRSLTLLSDGVLTLPGPEPVELVRISADRLERASAPGLPVASLPHLDEVAVEHPSPLRLGFYRLKRERVPDPDQALLMVTLGDVRYRVRMSEEAWVICDHSGRVVVIDRSGMQRLRLRARV